MAPDEFLFEYKERIQKKIDYLITKNNILQNELYKKSEQVERMRNEILDLKSENIQLKNELNKNNNKLTL